MSAIKIAFTGHRHLSYNQVVSYMNKLHQDYPDAIWVTGGAVGLDSLAASFAMAHNIKLWLILPFPPGVMSKFWSQAQRDVLERSIKYCDKFSVLSPVYDKSIYQRRNERMVDLSDMVAAFFDGTPGGTANCVRYAQQVGKRMVRFSDFSGKWENDELQVPGSSPDFCRKHASRVCAESKDQGCLGKTSDDDCDCKIQRPNYREVQGDIFTSETEAIVNTVNCVGVMGKGIALEFKNRYPELYIAYRQACARKEINPGRVWVYQTKGKIIFNAAVKDDWRDASRIAWVESCLQDLIEKCRAMKVRSLALPWMGAQNGWIPVEQIKDSTRRIMSAASDIDVSVYEIRRI